MFNRRIASLHCSTTIPRQCSRKTLWVNKLCQAAQPLHEARPRLLRNVHIDAVHLARFDGLDAAPVGTLIHERGTAAERRVFRQNDELRIRGNDRLVSYLWIAAVIGIAMEDVDA